MTEPIQTYPPDDRKLVELDQAHDEAAAVFQLTWRRLAEYIHGLDDDELEDRWDAASDALMAMMTADEVKTELGLKILLSHIPKAKKPRG